MTDCEGVGCDGPGMFAVFAAYDVGSADVHPSVKHYPAPMARVCPMHLVGILERDASSPGTTAQWVVRTAPDPSTVYRKA